jgi:hypothetical protein
MRLLRCIPIAACLSACGGAQPPPPTTAIAQAPAVAPFCAAAASTTGETYTITYAHPPSPTASTEVQGVAGVDMIRWTQEYRGDEGRLTGATELVCNGVGAALRRFEVGAESWEFEPPLTVLVAESSDGTTEGLVRVTAGTDERVHTYTFAWQADRHATVSGEFAGLTVEYEVTMRSVLYLDDLPDPAQQTETTWVVGDGLAVVRDRHAWHDNGERIDAASRLQRTP